MKRLAIVVTILALSGTTVLLSRVWQPVNPVAEPQDAFAAFPIGRPQVIEVGVPEPESSEPTLYARYTAKAAGIDLDAALRREQVDQIRDWLLITVLSAARLSVDDLNQALYDLPPVRRSQFDRIARFENGDTRARTMSGGQVIALVPAGSPEQQTDALAQIADEERKNTGEMPRTIEVFEYELAPDLRSATVTRRTPLAGRELFTAERGYVELRLTSAADLAAFLGAVDDLVQVSVGDGVTVGGRRFQSRKYRGIKVEDVAAIWQSEQSLEGREHGSGFSLDPQFDFGSLRRAFDDVLVNELRGARQPESVIEAAGAALAAKDIGAFLDTLGTVCQAATRDREQCNKSIRQLVLEHRFQSARYDGRLKGTEVGMVLFYTDLLMKLWSLDYERSAPRAVAGFPNEVAMEVAAIYRTEVEDLPGTRLWLGSLDEGYQVASDRQELLFARTATRVFAVPNDTLTGKDVTETTEPHVYDRTFMTWWNDHYAEVARYEPEYERLNEIMKWSQAIVWMNTSGRTASLDFLGTVPVDQSQRFTDWVHRHPELTFSNWAAVRFKPAGYGGSTTESLDILRSSWFEAFGEKHAWSGGVTLARRAEFIERATLADDVPVLARRARLDYGKSNPAKGELRTLQAVEYELPRSGGATARTVARVPTTQRLRGLVSEFKHTDIERSIARPGGDLVIRTRAVEGNVGDLHVTRTPTGFRTAWSAREIDRGRAIATRASMADDVGRSLARDPDVASFVRVDDSFLVKAVDADRWMRITRAADGSKAVRTGFDGRVSGTGSHARALDVGWVDDATAGREIGGSGWVQLAPERPSTGAGFVVDARGPPAGAPVKAVPWGDRRIPVVETPGGQRAVRAADLPIELRQDPARLRAFLEDGQPLAPVDTEVVRLVETGRYPNAAQALADDPARFRAAVDGHLAAERRAVARLIEDGQFAQARRRSDTLLAAWGDIPEVRLQRALAQLGEGDSTGAARTLQAGFRRPPSSVFFDEINRRLADPRLSTQARAQLADVRSVARWHGDKAANPKMPGDLVVAPERGGLRIEYRVEALPDSRGVDVAQIDEAAVFYVDDTPGLNNIDWSPGTLRPTLQSLVNGGRVHVDLLHVELARYRPTRITVAKRQASLTRISPRGVQPFADDDCDGANRDHARCRAYVVTEIAPSSARPR